MAEREPARHRVEVNATRRGELLTEALSEIKSCPTKNSRLVSK
ncbi:hypothetical protein SAMN04490239_1066 [Rhodococcus koreensis]|uniref:Uncharacterized protein n=1 Tax=Rhodococcus koreensis TaxID=99653 RepID=A0A1H4L355_9NOCA|nr:hypothetical protein SAMN04490239_1066 [Rhodococcus koreensis]